jgi:hypothetical protein
MITKSAELAMWLIFTSNSYVRCVRSVSTRYCSKLALELSDVLFQCWNLRSNFYNLRVSQSPSSMSWWVISTKKIALYCFETLARMLLNTCSAIDSVTDSKHESRSLYQILFLNDTENLDELPSVYSPHSSFEKANIKNECIYLMFSKMERYWNDILLTSFWKLSESWHHNSQIFWNLNQFQTET